MSIRHAFDTALHALSWLAPRRNDRWAFVGWHRGAEMEIFADNTKYLFLHIAREHTDIEPVWLAKDPMFASLLRSRGFVSYYEKSFRGIWYALTSGTTVIDAFLQPENYRYAGGTRLVQLLHGKGMKKGGYAQKPLYPQSVIFSTSPFVSSMLPPVFVQKSLIEVAGYPRADVFFSEFPGNDIGVDEGAQALLTNDRYQKRILYAPTFRRGVEKLDLDAILDLPRLSAWLVEHKYLMLMSLHPKYRAQARALSYPNIQFVEESDVYPLLPRVDLLITDYSSLFTDYLLLNRPIIFYAYDLESYKEKEGLSFNDYDEYMPGPKASTPEELLATLEATLSHDAHAADRARVRDLYHTYQDGNSAKRIMRYLRAVRQ